MDFRSTLVLLRDAIDASLAAADRGELAGLLKQLETGDEMWKVIHIPLSDMIAETLQPED